MILIQFTYCDGEGCFRLIKLLRFTIFSLKFFLIKWSELISIPTPIIIKHFRSFIMSRLSMIFFAWHKIIQSHFGKFYFWYQETKLLFCWINYLNWEHVLGEFPFQIHLDKSFTVKETCLFKLVLQQIKYKFDKM